MIFAPVKTPCEIRSLHLLIAPGTCWAPDCAKNFGPLVREFEQRKFFGVGLFPNSPQRVRFEFQRQIRVSQVSLWLELVGPDATAPFFGFRGIPITFPVRFGGLCKFQILALKEVWPTCLQTL